MDELKPCPFCGQKAEHSPINGSVCCPVRGIGKHTDYLRPDVWQTRPIEDALQNQLNVMSEHSAALAVSNYDLIAENNALQQRVEELEKLSDAHKKLACLVDKQHQETLASIRKAVEEIEDSMQSADWEVASVYDGALLILKNHGLVEDK